MRLGGPLFVISTTLLVTAVAIGGQDQKKAEDVYKNIQSFKGEPAASILPAMEFMSRSLNVECDFCHEQDRASDAKRAKLTARKMIEMTRDINAKNFGGRTQVTCATCHAGHETPIAVPPVVGSDVQFHRATDITPEKVLAAYDAADGQAKDIQTIKALRFRGDSTMGASTGRVTSTIELPNKFVSVSSSPQGDQTWVSNGAQVWWKASQGVITIPPEVAPQMTKFDRVYLGSASLPTLSNPRTAKATIDGHDVWVLVGTDATNERVGLFFDAKSGLLDRVAYYTPTILGNQEDTYDYSDYRRIHGVMIPMTVAQHVTGRDTTRHFTHVDVNPAVSDAEFEQPSK